MDNVREKVKEQNKSRNRKVIMGLIIIFIIVASAVMIEKNISTNITELSIEKSSITAEKAKFIPVKQLNTSVIAIKLSDGSYRLAFDDCKSCYMQFGKHAKFKNNKDNTGIICKNCKSEVPYEDIGYDFGDVAIPYPIYENEIVASDDKFVLTVDYLEKHKLIFDDLRQGKGMTPLEEKPEK